MKKQSAHLTPRSMSLQPVLIVAIALALATIARMTPHTSNMTPIFAVGLAAGAWLGRERQVLAGLMVIAAMLVGDLALGLHWTMPFVYFGMYLGAVLGARSIQWLEGSDSAWGRMAKAAGVAGFGSLLFFVMSNLGVWFVGELYPRTFEGLVQCFVMAVPFFKQSLATDLFFGSVFLYAVALARRSFRDVSWIASQKGGSVHGG